MPELPEVETVRLSLLPHLSGRVISRVEVGRPGQIRHPEPERFTADLVGVAVVDIRRRGKYLLIDLAPPATLIGHLRMSGQLVYVAAPATVPRPPHTHVVFHLDNGAELRYTDTRAFGGFHLVGPDGRGTPTGLVSLGPEPLSGDFTPACLKEALRGRRTPIKAALLDQSLIAGLGNIYVDEALWQARIHPRRPAASLSPAEVVRLYGAIRQVLTRAVALRGTSFSQYIDGQGRRGGFVEHLQVFRRTGLPCPACGRAIERIKLAGRSTHLCSGCQPDPQPGAEADLSKTEV